ncbi:MAG TPA: type II toxin-antitoxin system prevent-host-death family antitoxin [Parvibaculum sp.]|jgi:prevent-host-death family protein
MREIQASEAKTHFSSLLDDVERGETIAITRHGKVIAQLEPKKDDQQAKVAQTFAKLEELRKTVRSKVTTEEILQWRHEGHKY